MIRLYHILFYNPIIQAMVFVYDKIAFQDLGLSIIIITIFIRVVLFPVFYKSAKNQTVIQKIQPHIKRIQKDLKDNKEEQVKAMMELYKEHKVNPFSSILLVIVQLPIIIALYQVILKEVSRFDNFTLLGFINLREKNLVLAVLAAFLQYYQVKISLPKENSGNKSAESALGSKNLMLILGPVITFGVLTRFPSALGIYWITSTAFSLVQQFFINKIVYGRNIEENRKPG